MEQWKPLKTYEESYEVSTYGRIRSIDRQTTRNGHIMTLKGKVLKPGINKNTKYFIVNLRKNGKSKSWNLHQLLALTFLNYSLKDNLVVDHIDENPQNNHINNLQVTTQQINSVKGNNKRSNRPPGVNKDNNRNKWMAKITENGKRRLIGRYDTMEEAAEAYQRELRKLTTLQLGCS